MKRGFWLVITLFLVSIPSVMAKNTLGDLILGTSDADFFLLKALYFMFLFTLLFKLSQQQLFKEQNERKFAMIISLCMSLIAVWFTPDSTLNAFKWILILFVPFMVFYYVTGLVIKPRENDERRVDWTRLIIALILTFLMFIGLGATPAFGDSVRDTPLIGLALDELFSDVNYFFFYGLQPLWGLIIIGAVILGFIRLFRYIRTRGAGGEDGANVSWLRWIAILIAVIVGLIILMMFAGGFGGFGGLNIANIFWGVLKWIAIVLVVLGLLYLLIRFRGPIGGMLTTAGRGIGNFFTGRTRNLRVTIEPAAGVGLNTDTEYDFIVSVRRGWFRGSLYEANVTVRVNDGQMTGPDPGVSGQEITGQTRRGGVTYGGVYPFSYRSPDVGRNVTFTVSVTAERSRPITRTFTYPVGGGVNRPNVNLVPANQIILLNRPANLTVNVAGGAAPANGVAVTVNNLPPGTVTPGNTGNTVANNFPIAFTPTANGTFNVQADATHTSYSGTATGNGTITVIQGRMHIVVAYIPLQTPLGNVVNINVVVRENATGLGLNGVNLTFTAPGATPTRNTGPGGVITSPVSITAAQATAGISVMDIRVNATDPSGSYQEVNGTIQVGLLAPGNPPVGMRTDVLY